MEEAPRVRVGHGLFHRRRQVEPAALHRIDQDGLDQLGDARRHAAVDDRVEPAADVWGRWRGPHDRVASGSARYAAIPPVTFTTPAMPSRASRLAARLER